MNTPYNCTYCVFSTRHFERILKHYEYVHSRKDGFQVTCGINRCQRKFRSIRCFRRHILHFHKRFANCQLGNTQASVEYLQQEEGDIQDSEELGENALPNPTPDVVNNFDYVNWIGHFLLNLRERYSANKAACSYVAGEISNLLQVNNEQFAVRVGNAIDGAGSIAEVDIQSALVEQNNCSIAACEKLASSRKLDSYVINNLNYVPPVQHILNEDNGVSHTMQYVSILETLKSLLKHEDILSEVLTQRLSTDGRVRDYCDGTLYQNNALFQNNHIALQVILYFDEFTLTNPYRDRGKNYKISAVYLQLGNLHPKYRSSLENIHLVLLCKHLYVKKYGFDAVLRPCIRDLQVLESEGIDIQLDDNHYHFFGTVSYVVADNLGAHGIGGLYENFSTVLRLCRFCNATKPTLTLFREEEFQLRSVESWSRQVTAIQADPTLAPVYGIKAKSPLDNLQYFNVVHGLPSDIAHDFLEGIAPALTKATLVSIITERHITYEQLSELVRSFPYAKVDKSNKVPLLGTNAGTFKIKFTQAQMLCFLRLLPLMVGGYVPVTNTKWDLFLLMVDVLEAICAPSFSASDIQYINGLVESFNILRCELYPNENTKPKHHYIIHYGSQIQKYGPLKYCWTIRFEGKHEQFKQMFRKSKNRTNVSKSLAVNHQMHQAVLHEKTQYLHGDQPEYTGIKTNFTDLLPNTIQSILHPLIGLEQEEIAEADQVILNGISYPVGCAVVLEHNDSEEMYVFGKIRRIFLIRDTPHICSELMQYVEYDRHYRSFRTQPSGVFDIRTISELYDHMPLGVYSMQDDDMIVLKYHIP